VNDGHRLHPKLLSRRKHLYGPSGSVIDSIEDVDRKEVWVSGVENTATI
jgi:hypothetical protein